MSDPGLAPHPVADDPDGRANSGAPGTRADAPDGRPDAGLRLRRWTMTTGSGSERAAGSRAAVVLAAGDSQWEATAESAGAIGALFGALDAALEEVLGAGCAWWPSTSTRSARHVDLVAACADAYLAALRALLADDAWAGAVAAAGNDRLARVRAQAARSAARAEIDADAALDSADWFNP
jgi:hypothetical protein